MSYRASGPFGMYNRTTTNAHQPGRMQIPAFTKKRATHEILPTPKDITDEHRRIVLEETARYCTVPVQVLMEVRIKEHPAVNARSLAIAVLLAMGDKVVRVAETFDIQPQAVRYAKLKVMADPVRIRVRNTIHKKAVRRIDGGGDAAQAPRFEVHWGKAGLLDADRAEILGVACRYLGIRPANLRLLNAAGGTPSRLGEDQRRQRCIVAAVLVACHDARNSVARVLNRNHTSVRHALRQVHESADLQRERDAVLDMLPDRFRPMHGRPAPIPPPPPNLASLSAEQSAVVRAYVAGELLHRPGSHRMNTNLQLQVLMLLGRCPDAMEAVAAEVAAAGFKGHAEQLRRRASTFVRPQARKIG